MRKYVVLSFLFISLTHGLAKTGHDDASTRPVVPKSEIAKAIAAEKEFSYEFKTLPWGITDPQTWQDAKILEKVIYQPIEVEEHLSERLSKDLRNDKDLTNAQRIEITLEVFKDRVSRLERLKQFLQQKLKEAEEKEKFWPFSNMAAAYGTNINLLIDLYKKKIDAFDKMKSTPDQFSDPGCPACEMGLYPPGAKDNHLNARQKPAAYGPLLVIAKPDHKIGFAGLGIAKDGRATVTELGQPPKPLTDPTIAKNIASYYRNSRTLKDSPITKAFLAENATLLGEINLSKLKQHSSDKGGNPAPFKVGEKQVTPYTFGFGEKGLHFKKPIPNEPGSKRLLPVTEKDGVLYADGKPIPKPNLEMADKDVLALSPVKRAERDFVRHLGWYLLKNYPDADLTKRVVQHYFGVASSGAAGEDDNIAITRMNDKLRLGASGKPFQDGVGSLAGDLSGHAQPPTPEQLANYVANPGDYVASCSSTPGAPCEFVNQKNPMDRFAKHGVIEWTEADFSTPRPQATSSASASNIPERTGKKMKDLIDEARSAGKKYLLVTVGNLDRCPRCVDQHHNLESLVDHPNTLIVYVDGDKEENAGFFSNQMTEKGPGGMPRNEIFEITADGSESVHYWNSSPMSASAIKAYLK